MRVISIVIMFYLHLAACRRSGIYIDNGVDQTLLQKGLTRRERSQVELEILNLLGMSHRPEMNRRPELTRSAPQFLLDVYKAMLDEDDDASKTGGREVRSEFTLSRRDRRAIDESDVIISFLANNSRVAPRRHERGKRLWFEIVESPDTDSIVDAELRLYQESREESYMVTVYQMTSLENGESAKMSEVAAVQTTPGAEGWITLNATQILSDWILTPEKNQGLYVAVHPAGRPGHEIKPDNAGLILTINEKENMNRQPFLVGYFKAKPGQVKRDNVLIRQRREVFLKRKKKYSSDSGRIPFEEPRDTSHWQKGHCRIQNLFVSFKELNWEEWVIAPEGFAAYYCRGECNFPLNAHMNATNHAIVQTLVHLVKGGSIPKPCCVPTKLAPISLLYFSDDVNVILRKFKDIVVKSCGCH